MTLSIDAIITDINHINKHFGKFIIDNNISRHENKISWKGYKSGISKLVYIDDYNQIIDDRQFSLMLVDESLVQLFYEFNEDGSLKKAKLAYYPKPISGLTDLDRYAELLFDAGYVDDALSMFDVDEIEPGKSALNCSHLRFDYDSKVNSHTKSHLQYSGINAFRFPTNIVLTPFLFLEFLFTNIESTKGKLNIAHDNYVATWKSSLGNCQECNDVDQTRLHISMKSPE